MKIIYYLETIAAIGLKVDLSIQINELLVMKVNEIKGQGHYLYLTLAKGHSEVKIKTCFLGNYRVIWNQISYESLWVNGNEYSYK